MKLSVAMIVKNEEVMLGRCLKSVSGADEIIAVGTGAQIMQLKVVDRLKEPHGDY